MNENIINTLKSISIELEKVKNINDVKELSKNLALLTKQNKLCFNSGVLDINASLKHPLLLKERREFLLNKYKHVLPILPKAYEFSNFDEAGFLFEHKFMELLQSLGLAHEVPHGYDILSLTEEGDELMKAFYQVDSIENYEVGAEYTSVSRMSNEASVKGFLFDNDFQVADELGYSCVIVSEHSDKFGATFCVSSKVKTGDIDRELFKKLPLRHANKLVNKLELDAEELNENNLVKIESFTLNDTNDCIKAKLSPSLTGERSDCYLNWDGTIIISSDKDVKVSQLGEYIYAEKYILNNIIVSEKQLSRIYSHKTYSLFESTLVIKVNQGNSDEFVIRGDTYEMSYHVGDSICCEPGTILYEIMKSSKVVFDFGDKPETIDMPPFIYDVFSEFQRFHYGLERVGNIPCLKLSIINDGRLKIAPEHFKFIDYLDFSSSEGKSQSMYFELTQSDVIGEEDISNGIVLSVDCDNVLYGYASYNNSSLVKIDSFSTNKPIFIYDNVSTRIPDFIKNRDDIELNLEMNSLRVIRRKVKKLKTTNDIGKIKGIDNVLEIVK